SRFGQVFGTHDGGRTWREDPLPPGVKDVYAIACGGRMTDKIRVLNPVGFPPKVVRQPLAPRLPSLQGKTLYPLHCLFHDSDLFLKQMPAWLAEHMPSVRTVFKPISSVYLKDDPATWEEIRARGDAAVLGVGH